MNPKYSIVTPMFNSFDLMGRYFESLNNQTFKDFEVIIVDDYSTDGSYEKVCQYSKESLLNISVYRVEKNMGPGNARNIGMDAAKGEWITFIDSDDWVSINLFEKIEEAINNNVVNCVIYDYYTTNGKENRIGRSMYCGTRGKIPVSNCIASVRNHSIGKFYKLSNCRINGIRFPELKRCEDVAFVCRAIDACGSAYYLNEPLYYYYQQPTSLSNNKYIDETDMIKAFGILEDKLGDKYSEELKEKSVPDLLYGVLLMMCKAGKDNEAIYEYIEKYESKYPKWYLCECVNYLGKAKRVFLIMVKHKCIYGIKLLSWIHSRMIGQ